MDPLPHSVSDHEPEPDGEGQAVRLVQLGAGRRARMQAAELTREDCELLHALGLTDSCLLKVCKAGDPCIVQVRSTRIGLSPRLAERILVVPSHPEL